MYGKAIFWHRRDLRLQDNAGLYKALKNSEEVIPVFIFDTSILNQLERHDQRIIFIHQNIEKLRASYQKLGSDLLILHGDPIVLIPKISLELKVDAVFSNRDYEPKAIERDKIVSASLKEQGIKLIGSKDQVIFEKDEIVKNDGNPYLVFTPYSVKWKEKLNDFYTGSYPTERYFNYLTKQTFSASPTLLELEFSGEQTQKFPGMDFPENIIQQYSENRDYPSLNGTSKLGVHLRFGTISIRALLRFALNTNKTYLNELIWREFYQMILYHFPHSADQSFKKQYDSIPWLNNEADFGKWCRGETGYPLVDAGMRELNATGFMHNRVRMVTASFLSKHLLIDWRWGEAYFAGKLLDYELASNSGGWQWAAGSGCDAAPYFRVFNPQLQLEKFDKNLEYVRKWVPEYATAAYPDPIVDHKMARERAIETYKRALSKTE